jgi:hypothetical protein
LTKVLFGQDGLFEGGARLCGSNGGLRVRNESEDLQKRCVLLTWFFGQVLLLDEETTSVVSVACSQSAMLQKEVFLFEQLSRIAPGAKSRELMPHLKCVVFVRPTQDNLDVLVSVFVFCFVVFFFFFFFVVFFFFFFFFFFFSSSKNKGERAQGAEIRRVLSVLFQHCG